LIFFEKQHLLTMKKLVYILSVAFLVSATPTFAQKKSKADKKAEKNDIKTWEKKLKDMSPKEYEKMKTEHPQLKSESAALKKQVEGLNGLKKEANTQLSAANAELEKAKADCSSLISNAEKNQDLTPKSNDYSKGICFKVQIGAFEKILPSDVPIGANGRVGAETEDGLNKFVIGYFRDYGQAKTFKEYLDKMGVKKPFVVPYENGNRMSDINEALRKAGQEQYIINK